MWITVRDRLFATSCVIDDGGRIYQATGLVAGERCVERDQ
jgi:hypothetical protein